MIKFFRNIRKKLVNENKFIQSSSPASRYLLYAFGEIILVVIGILIALQINSWNQDRINSRKEQDYLIGLKNDLEKQIISFEDSNRFNDFIVSKGESILVEFSSNGNILEIDSINKKLSYLMYTSKYLEFRTTFNELNSTGQINLIKEKSLRSEVIRYYQNSEYHKEGVNGNTDNVIYNQIFPIIKSSIIIDPENFNFGNERIQLEEKLKTTFEKNLNNSDKLFELVNAISLRIIVSQTNKSHVQEAQNEAQLLLDHINNELRLK